MIEIVREPNGPVTIRISDENIEDVKEILSSLFRESNFLQNRIQALSSRFEDLEASIGELVGVNKELAEVLLQRKDQKRARLPAQGTKYFQRLWQLCAAHLDTSFTSDDLPAKERHILSILKNEYDVLEVAEKKGRRNFYQVKPEIARQLMKLKGHWFSVIVDAEGRARTESLVSQEMGRTPFLTDSREGESGMIYEFYFPDVEAGEGFEEKVLSGRAKKAE